MSICSRSAALRLRPHGCGSGSVPGPRNIVTFRVPMHPATLNLAVAGPRTIHKKRARNVTACVARDKETSHINTVTCTNYSSAIVLENTINVIWYLRACPHFSRRRAHHVRMHPCDVPPTLLTTNSLYIPYTSLHHKSRQGPNNDCTFMAVSDLICNVM